MLEHTISSCIYIFAISNRNSKGFAPNENQYSGMTVGRFSLSHQFLRKDFFFQCVPEIKRSRARNSSGIKSATRGQRKDPVSAGPHVCTSPTCDRWPSTWLMMMYWSVPSSFGSCKLGKDFGGLKTLTLSKLSSVSRNRAAQYSSVPFYLLFLYLCWSIFFKFK